MSPGGSSIERCRRADDRDLLRRHSEGEERGPRPRPMRETADPQAGECRPKIAPCIEGHRGVVAGYHFDTDVIGARVEVLGAGTVDVTIAEATSVPTESRTRTSDTWMPRPALMHTPTAVKSLVAVAR